MTEDLNDPKDIEATIQRAERTLAKLNLDIAIRAVERAQALGVELEARSQREVEMLHLHRDQEAVARKAWMRTWKMHPRVKRKLVRMTIWCAKSRCRVGTVYELSEGMLLVTTGDTTSTERPWVVTERPVAQDEEVFDASDPDWHRASPTMLTMPSANAFAEGLTCRCANDASPVQKATILALANDPTVKNIKVGDTRLS